MGNLKVMVMVTVMMMVAMMVMIAMMVMVLMLMMMVMVVMMMVLPLLALLAAAAAAPMAAATVTTIATAFTTTAASMRSPLLAAYCRQHVLTAAATATTTPCNEVGVHLVIFLAPRAPCDLPRPLVIFQPLVPWAPEAVCWLAGWAPLAASGPLGP